MWFLVLQIHCNYMNPTINCKSPKAHLPLLYTVFCFYIFSFSSLSLKDEALWSFLVQQVSLLLRINPTPALEMRQCVKSANVPGTLCEMRWGPLGGDLLLATPGRDNRYQKLGGVAELAENGEMMEILTSTPWLVFGVGVTYEIFRKSQRHWQAQDWISNFIQFSRDFAPGMSRHVHF